MPNEVPVVRIALNDSRYRRSQDQEFLTFDEADRFLEDYCGACTQTRKCAINNGLRRAMGENYPYWHEKLVKRELKLMTTNPEGILPGTVINCRRFQLRRH